MTNEENILFQRDLEARRCVQYDRENSMTLSDFFKLIRHYIKMVIIVPVVCAFVATAVVAAIPPTYIAKATLLTNGDIALAGGYA